MKLFKIYDYEKGGKGVSKDEPKGTALANFFIIFGRKLGKLVQLNLLFLLPFSLILALCVVLFVLPVPRYDLTLSMGIVTYNIPLWNMYVVTAPLILGSPFIAGLTYITRNFAREEHAFIWGDFKSAVLTNWKPFLLHGVILYLLYVPLSFADIYYYASISESWGYAVPFVFCVIVSLVVIFAQFYVPVMIVTFDLKLRQIYKNALIFSVLGFKQNLILSVSYALLIFVLYKGMTYMMLTLLLVGVFAIFLLFSMVSFIGSYCVYPVIDKYLIQPYYRQQTQSGESAEKLQLLYPKDELDEDMPAQPEKKSEYVYVNGKLIKREDYEGKEAIFRDTH